MTKRAPLSLKSAAVNKAVQPEAELPPTVPDDTPPPVATIKDWDTREPGIGLTVHLVPEAWEQLKMLSISKRTPMHDLLVHAVNLVFEENDKPLIARPASRPPVKKPRKKS